MSQEFYCEDDHAVMVENFIAETMQAYRDGGDKTDAAYFAQREETKAESTRPVRLAVIMDIERVLRYPGASDGIFAVY